MNLLLAIARSTEVDPPSGGISPLAWVIILALVGAIGAICGVGMRWVTKLYDDLKECNASRAVQDEDTLGLLKVLRVQMEQSKGGRQR